MERLALDADMVSRELKLPQSWVEELRRLWSTLVDLSVWGEIGSGELGSVPRFRKRVLELGERLAALDAARAWIPRPREQLKSALASALAAQESLERCEQVAAKLDRGADQAALYTQLATLRSVLLPELEARARHWGSLLDMHEHSKE